MSTNTEDLVIFAEGMGWPIRAMAIDEGAPMSDNWDPFTSEHDAVELAEKLDIRFERVGPSEYWAHVCDEDEDNQADTLCAAICAAAKAYLGAKR